jgi:hypothetical protein
MALIQDIQASFKAKGLQYVSMSESTKDRQKTVITYKDSAGKTLTKDRDIELEQLKEDVAEVDIIDPDGLCDFILGNEEAPRPAPSG